jgi:hypothetical protein
MSDDEESSNDYEFAYGSCISKSICDLLELDFTPENIEERKVFYRQILVIRVLFFPLGNFLLYFLYIIGAFYSTRSIRKLLYCRRRLFYKVHRKKSSKSGQVFLRK